MSLLVSYWFPHLNKALCFTARLSRDQIHLNFGDCRSISRNPADEKMLTYILLAPKRTAFITATCCGGGTSITPSFSINLKPFLLLVLVVHFGDALLGADTYAIQPSTGGAD